MLYTVTGSLIIKMSIVKMNSSILTNNFYTMYKYFTFYNDLWEYEKVDMIETEATCK